MWIYLESSTLKIPVKMPIHKDGFRIFNLSSFDTARQQTNKHCLMSPPLSPHKMCTYRTKLPYLNQKAKLYYVECILQTMSNEEL